MSTHVRASHGSSINCLRIISDFVTCASCIFAHTFVSGMQNCYFSESQDAIVLKIMYLTHKAAVELIDMGTSESQDP